MKDKSFEELKEELASKYSSKFKGITQPDGSEGGPTICDLEIAYEDGWDACSKLFLEKHPAVVGLVEAYKELLDNLAHYASPRRDEYHPVKHEWKEVSE